MKILGIGAKSKNESALSDRKRYRARQDRAKESKAINESLESWLLELRAFWVTDTEQEIKHAFRSVKDFKDNVV